MAISNETINLNNYILRSLKRSYSSYDNNNNISFNSSSISLPSSNILLNNSNNPSSPSSSSFYYNNNNNLRARYFGELILLQQSIHELELLESVGYTPPNLKNSNSNNRLFLSSPSSSPPSYNNSYNNNNNNNNNNNQENYSPQHQNIDNRLSFSSKISSPRVSNKQKNIYEERNNQYISQINDQQKSRNYNEENNLRNQQFTNINQTPNTHRNTNIKDLKREFITTNSESSEKSSSKQTKNLWNSLLTGLGIGSSSGLTTPTSKSPIQPKLTSSSKSKLKKNNNRKEKNINVNNQLKSHSSSPPPSISLKNNKNKLTKEQIREIRNYQSESLSNSGEDTESLSTTIIPTDSPEENLRQSPKNVNSKILKNYKYVSKEDSSDTSSDDSTPKVVRQVNNRNMRQKKIEQIDHNVKYYKNRRLNKDNIPKSSRKKKVQSSEDESVESLESNEVPKKLSSKIKSKKKSSSNNEKNMISKNNSKKKILKSNKNNKNNITRSDSISSIQSSTSRENSDEESKDEEEESVEEESGEESDDEEEIPTKKSKQFQFSFWDKVKAYRKEQQELQKEKEKLKMEKKKQERLQLEKVIAKQNREKKKKLQSELSEKEHNTKRSGKSLWKQLSSVILTTESNSKKRDKSKSNKSVPNYFFGNVKKEKSKSKSNKNKNKLSTEQKKVPINSESDEKETSDEISTEIPVRSGKSLWNQLLTMKDQFKNNEDNNNNKKNNKIENKKNISKKSKTSEEYTNSSSESIETSESSVSNNDNKNKIKSLNKNSKIKEVEKDKKSQELKPSKKKLQKNKKRNIKSSSDSESTLEKETKSELENFSDVNSDGETMWNSVLQLLNNHKMFKKKKQRNKQKQKKELELVLEDDDNEEEEEGEEGEEKVEEKEDSEEEIVNRKEVKEELDPNKLNSDDEDEIVLARVIKLLAERKNKLKEKQNQDNSKNDSDTILRKMNKELSKSLNLPRSLSKSKSLDTNQSGNEISQSNHHHHQQQQQLNISPQLSLNSLSKWNLFSRDNFTPEYEKQRQGAVSSSSLTTSLKQKGYFEKTSTPEQIITEQSNVIPTNQQINKPQIDNNSSNQDYWKWLSEQQELRKNNSNLDENKKTLPPSLSQLRSQSIAASSLSSSPSPLSPHLSLKNRLQSKILIDPDNSDEESFSSSSNDENTISEDENTSYYSPNKNSNNKDQVNKPKFSIDESRIFIDWNCQLTPRKNNLTIDINSNSDSDSDSDSSESISSKKSQSSYYRGIRDVVAAADQVLASVRLEMENEEKQPKNTRNTSISPMSIISNKTDNNQHVLNLSDLVHESQPQEEYLLSNENNNEEDNSTSLSSLKLLYNTLEEKVNVIQEDVEELKRNQKLFQTNSIPSSFPIQSQIISPKSSSINSTQTPSKSLRNLSRSLSPPPSISSISSPSKSRSANQSPGLPITFSEWYTEIHRRDQVENSSKRSLDKSQHLKELL